jgi:creatinine amidohydrolase
MVTRMMHTRLHRLEQLSVKGLNDLDRSRTVIFLPVGMIEEHGDHLPLGTDNYGVDGLLLASASWLLEDDPALHVLLMPGLPYGTDPIDSRRPDLFVTAGSVWISADTLKAHVIDITEHMVRFGFRHIFPVSFHGGAGQIIALDDVCAVMRDRYPGLVMYEPTGYLMAGAAQDITPGLATLLGRPMTTQEEVALRSSIHASMFETSMMLHLRPELVDPAYKHLRTIEWGQMYNMTEWPGYVGAGPAHSNADVGGAVLRWRGVRAASLMRRAMNGEDLAALPRHPTWLDEPDAITEAPRENELPPKRHKPEIDSKPAMYIPREQLAEARELVQAQQGVQALPVADAEPIELPAELPRNDPNKTQPSARNQTPLGFHRLDQDAHQPNDSESV